MEENMHRHRWFSEYAKRILAVLVALLSPLPTLAQVYPAKPLRLMIGFPPGGQNDTLARLVALPLAKSIGQQVIVENRPGAGGNIAAEIVARSVPDGYTLKLISLPFAANPSLYKTVPYREGDFIAVAGIGGSPMVLAVHPSTPFRNAAELAAYAKRHPHRLNYGSGGTGSAQHLAFGLFQAVTGARLTHVPYKGGGPSLAALIAGEVDTVMAAITVMLPLVQQKRSRALLVAQETPSPLMPEVPSSRQAGLPGLLITNWNGVAAPAKTPPEIVLRLHAEITKVLAGEDIRQRFATMGAETMGGSREQFQAFVAAEFVKWAKVVRETGITPQ
jgi:tripartite-type tricarboxylate transporter receptor subunit TctC